MTIHEVLSDFGSGKLGVKPRFPIIYFIMAMGKIIAAG
jgi:hypothetical protein